MLSDMILDIDVETCNYCNSKTLLFFGLDTTTKVRLNVFIPSFCLPFSRSKLFIQYNTIRNISVSSFNKIEVKTAY